MKLGQAVAVFAASGAIHAMVFASLAFATPGNGSLATGRETVLLLETEENVPAPPVEPVPNEATHVPLHPPQAAVRPPASPNAAPDFLARFMTTIESTTSVSAAQEEGGGERPMAAPSDETTYGEDDVSTPARLLSHVDAAYPMPAWSSGLEADVPVEIVVDARGSVVSARVVTRAGHGFDDAALASLESYRFTPAQRDGHAVRVRVRWSIQFHLRR